jgi:hypothetical protein
MQTETPPTVTLAGRTWRLRKPTSLAALWDVALTFNEDRIKAGILALALCSPDVLLRLPYDGRPLLYAMKVADYLCTEGARFPDLLTASAPALDLCLSALPDVESASDFSGTSEGGKPSEVGSSSSS